MNTSYASDVASARAAYDILTPTQQGLVSNLAVLTTAEAGIVTDEASLASAIDNATNIFIANDIVLTAPVTVNKTVSINGNGKTLKAPTTFAAGLTHNTAVVIQANDVEVTNLTVDANAADKTVWQTPARFGMQVYDVTGVKLTEIILKNGHAGLLINAATASASVEVNGVKTSDNGFGGMEVFAVAGLTATLNLGDNNHHGFDSTTPAIWTEGTGTTTVSGLDNVYQKHESGTTYDIQGVNITVKAGQVHYEQLFQ